MSRWQTIFMNKCPVGTICTHCPQLYDCKRRLILGSSSFLFFIFFTLHQVSLTYHNSVIVYHCMALIVVHGAGKHQTNKGFKYISSKTTESSHYVMHTPNMLSWQWLVNTHYTPVYTLYTKYIKKQYHDIRGMYTCYRGYIHAYIILIPLLWSGRSLDLPGFCSS